MNLIDRLKTKKSLYILLGIIILAGAVRFYNPTFRSLWGDEAHSLFNAYDFAAHNFHFVKIGLKDIFSLTIKNSLGQLVGRDFHMPLYFFILSVWINFFGVSELALRSLSIVIGIMSVPLIYVMAKEFYDEKTALLSAFLLSVSSLAVLHSQEIRMYSLLILLSIASSLYFMRLISGKRGALNMLGYSISTVLFALTHLYAVLVFVAQFLYLLFVLFKKRDMKGLAPTMLLQAAIAVLVSPFYVNILAAGASRLASTKADFAFSVFPAYLKLLLYFFVLSLGETVAPWNWLVALPAGIVFGYLFLRTFKRKEDAGTVYLQFLCIFTVAISAFFLKPTMPKYLISVLPLYLILISRSLSDLSSKSLRYCLIIAICATQAISMFNYFNFKEYHNSNQAEPWRDMGTFIESGYHKGDIILSSNRFIAYRLLEYYLNVLHNGSFPILSLQKDEFAPNDPNERRIPLFDETKGGSTLTAIKNKRVWFITEIHDELIFTPGYIDRVRHELSKRYDLIKEKGYVPYDTTLASKLPKKRYSLSLDRMKLGLYSRK